MPKTSAERVAEYRSRLKQNIEVPQCKCTRPLKGRLSQIRQLCAACYKKCPDGRHQNWVITNRRRGREVLVEMLDSYGEWKKGTQAIAPDGSVGTVQAINSWVDGTVTAIVQFEEEIQDNFLISTPNSLIHY